MAAGVKLGCVILSLTIFSSSFVQSHFNSIVDEEFSVKIPKDEETIHSTEKKQISTRVDWNDNQPFLEGPNTDEIYIDGKFIMMDEEMEPNVTIALFNYKGPGEISFRYRLPTDGQTQLGLNYERQPDDKIFLISTLKQDYEAGHRTYSVDITITEGEFSKMQSIELEINNIDDNPPVVLAPSCAVDELYTGPTDCVFTIYDADGYISLNVMELRLIGSDLVNQSFNFVDRVININSFNLTVRLNVIQELDFFYDQIHVFELVAYDSLPNNGSAQVIVRVNDMPNMPPMWQSIFATQTFNEKTEQTFTVRAIDGDTMINQPICYYINKTYDDPVILIGEEDGVILVEPIDRDRLEEQIFPFDIVAYKCNNRSWITPSTAVFVVNDINDQIPESIVEHFEISILEETIVTLNFEDLIEFHDKDLGRNAQYTVTLESISPPSAVDSFLIVPKDGYQRQDFQISIMTASNLDYDTEEWQTILLRVVATEEVNPEHIGSATVTINLQNWNDELPIFNEEPYTATLNETAEADVYVATVMATDRDIGDKVIHSIRGSANSYLSIDEDTGEIKVKIDNAFDYDRQQEIVVQVEAKDTLNSTTSPVNIVLTQLTIQILDVNNKPPQITMPRDPTMIKEHETNGTIITQDILGSDVDTTAEIVFHIDWNASYATKQGRTVSSELFKGCVGIETIYEESSTRNAKGRLVALQIGPNPIDTLDFEIFEVLYLSIVLTDLKTEIDGMNQTAGILAINIEDINDNKPIWNPDTSTKTYYVREEADSLTVIDSVQATDIDGPKYNVISYSMKARNGTKDGLLQINGETGQITVLNGKDISADFPVATYQLYYTLTASDCTEETEDDCHEVDIDIGIDIIDTNNQTPFEEEDKGTKTTVPIKEHSPEGTLVTTIRGKDWDRDNPYNNVSYTIDYRILPDLEKVFAIDLVSGKVTTKHPDDLERDYGVTRHSIPIQLIDNFFQERDQTRRTNSTTIEVILLDINDNAPEFQPLNDVWTVSENTDKDALVATIRAYDRDEENTPRSQVEYKILSVIKVGSGPAEDASELFYMKTIPVNDGTIYKFAGELHTTTHLESHWGTYNISIEAHDKPVDEEIMRASTTHQLIVEPSNFNIPLITYPVEGQTIRLSLEEAEFGRLRYAANGTALHSVTAVDDDGGDAGKVTLTIIGDETAQEFFGLSNTVNNEAQFELNNRISVASAYRVTILATDHGQPSFSSNITFTFEVMSTDTMPQFLDSSYTTNFTEGETGKIEDQLLPEAVDLLGGRALYYYIEDFKALFTVNKITRVMRIREGQVLNRTEKDKYEIRYRVAIVDPDIEGNPRHNEMIINIDVREENPRPVFELSQYVGGISTADTISKRIMTVKAHHSENLPIRYKIEMSTMEADPSLQHITDPFNLDSQTGDLTLQFRPVATMTGQFKFNVSATDSDEVSSMAIVIVFLVTESNRITFSFLNKLEEVEEKRNIIAVIFTEEFEYQCSVDSIENGTDASGLPVENTTDVRTHFTENGIAINADILAEKRGDYEFVSKLIRRFNDVNLILGDFLSSPTIEESMEQMLQIVLIVVSTVLGTLCILLVVAFCLHTRSLKRRLEALSVTKFGSQDSGLNRVGVTVPGTNKHALEGSNPVWNEANTPNFDEVSNYSGDSDLIGIEDNPQFAYDNKAYEKNNDQTMNIGRNLTLDDTDRTRI